jgi:hypothetical protein
MFYEQPFFIPGAPGNARQDITKLTMMAGIISGYATATGFKTFPVEVLDWKGQTPKKISHQRIKGRLSYYRDWDNAGHDVCAAGVGLWVQGRF